MLNNNKSKLNSKKNLFFQPMPNTTLKKNLLEKLKNHSLHPQKQEKRKKERCS